MPFTPAPPVRELAGAVQFAKTISEHDVYAFAGLTGDFYPLHVNAVYAATQPVGERVAHGAFLVGLMSAAAAQWMQRHGIDGLSYGYDGLRFIQPVRLGDTITVAHAEVERSADGRKVTCRVEGRNQRDEVVGAARHLIWSAA